MQHPSTVNNHHLNHSFHHPPPNVANKSSVNNSGHNSNRNFRLDKHDNYRNENVHQHHRQLYSSNPFTSSSSFFPSSSLRDIISLIFILLSLPQAVSLFLIIVYIVLGSNFMGGKFIIEFLLLQDHPQPVTINYKQSCVTMAKILVINSTIFLALNSFVHKKSYFNYIIILSKSIISSDLIGASSINYINSISHKRITTKIQYDDNKKFLNSHVINSVICFLVINYINYLISWLNLSFKFIKFYSNNIGYINNLTFHHLNCKLYIILCIHIINSTIFKKSTILQSSIPNITDNDNSVQANHHQQHGKLVEINLKYAMPSLSNIQPSSNSVAIKNFENFIISPFNSKLTILKNRLRSNTSSSSINTIIPNNIRGGVPVVNVNSNTSNSNNNGTVQLVNTSTSQTPSVRSTTTTSSTTSTSTSLTTTTVSNNVTTIENTVIIQPFWSILAASKAILRNPKLFNGEHTRRKNIIQQEQKSSNAVKSFNIVMSVILIDDSKVVFKLLKKPESVDIEDLRVNINNVSWSYYKFSMDNDNDNLIIYGLSSAFQYEIDIIYKEDQVVQHFLITTENVNSDDENGSDRLLLQNESSSLTTSQISLISTLRNLNALKLKYKKFKKDEHKRLLDLKNNIDNLKNKIAKYNKSAGSNETRVFGKLKGLKHSVLQLESEIEQLNSRIIELTAQEEQIKKDFKGQEQKYTNQISKLELVYEEYLERIKVEKLKLKSSTNEIQALNAKTRKLITKQQGRSDEIKALNNELKGIKKNDVLNKFTKRIKRTNEKFEIILPKVLAETQLLRDECNQVLNT